MKLMDKVSLLATSGIPDRIASLNTVLRKRGKIGTNRERILLGEDPV
jgi:hypothetical protein